MKILFNVICLSLGLLVHSNLYAQENKKDWERPNWSLSYRIGIADGATNDYFNTIHVVGLKKSFNVAEPISLNLLTDFSHAKGKLGSDINAVSLGGGISLYPVYLVSLILGNPYEIKEDNVYIDFGLQALLNKSDFDFIYTLEANVYKFKLKNNQSLSPKIAYNLFISDKETSSNPLYQNLKDNMLGFYSIGIAYNF